MNFFDRFTSNSLAGSGSQLWFSSDPKTIHTGRLFYRITHGGTYNYSLLFSNILDSTYSDGSKGHCNMILPGWEILSARVGKAPAGSIGPDFAEQAASVNDLPTDFQPLTFDGKSQKAVAPGEFFTSDALPLYFEGGDYLCLELTFRGSRLPYHEETHLPVYRRTAEGWCYDKRVPFPAMIGCDRPVARRVGFIGDSITQGIGTPPNSYLGWNAQLAAAFPQEIACWNLGLGFGRAADLASGGAWLYKALQNDVLFVCYGVNDLYQYGDADLLIRHLNTIVHYLTQANKTVLVQTVPPFDYPAHLIPLWEQVNHHIRTVLASRVDGIFDVVPVLGQENAPHMAKYGGHPDAEGCRMWACALSRYLESLPRKIF